MRIYYHFADEEKRHRELNLLVRVHRATKVAGLGFESRQSDSSIHTLNRDTASLRYIVDPCTMQGLSTLT